MTVSILGLFTWTCNLSRLVLNDWEKLVRDMNTKVQNLSRCDPDAEMCYLAVSLKNRVSWMEYGREILRAEDYLLHPVVSPVRYAPHHTYLANSGSQSVIMDVRNSPEEEDTAGSAALFADFDCLKEK